MNLVEAKPYQEPVLDLIQDRALDIMSKMTYI